MPDTTKVCALCGFYNETSMTCERFPPHIQDRFVNSDGDDDCFWHQPFISHPWHTRCGEWQEINDPVDNDEHPDNEAAFARLKLIAQAYEEQNKESQKENNANRDGT